MFSSGLIKAAAAAADDDDDDDAVNSPLAVSLDSL